MIITTKNGQPSLFFEHKKIKTDEVIEILSFLMDGSYAELLLSFLKSKISDQKYHEILSKTMYKTETSMGLLELAKIPMIDSFPEQMISDDGSEI